MMRLALSTVLLISSLCASVIEAAEFSVEKTEHGARVMFDGKLVTDYLIDAGPKPYCWPLMGPNDRPITRAYPMREAPGERQDHPHHRSFWFTHGDVNGVDFWSESARAGSILHREFKTLSGGERGTIETVNDWVAPDGKKICEDERRLVFSIRNGARVVDFDITLRAASGPVTFGDTKEGTFGLRVPTAMDVDRKQGGRIVNSEGHTDGDAWGKRAAWVDYHGPVEGDVVGVAILNHPSSFRYPTYWHVRTYGLFAANPFGVHDFLRSASEDGSHTLAEGESFSLRYRVILHAGDERSAAVAEAFEAYAREER